jgi:selenide,water dikinase
MGLAAPDDAAAVRAPRGGLVVSSLDSFRAFTDDPFLVGRVAAVNAASDLWAKGVEPRFALAQVQVPEHEDAGETLFQVLAGARAGFDPEGVTLVGGHSTTGGELQVGFAVQGFASAAEDLLRLGGLRPGDRLILTKPLGTGVVFHADMRALAPGPWVEAWPGSSEPAPAPT